MLSLCGPSKENSAPIVICNSTNGELIKVPEHSHGEKRINKQQTFIQIGFGFQPKTNEYKVIKTSTRTQHWYVSV